MIKKIAIIIIFFILMATAGAAKGIDGWVRGDTCWVVRSPKTEAIPVGILRQKAAITVEKYNNNWLKIVYAPVRKLPTLDWLECAGCFIQRKDFTEKRPDRW